MVLLEALTIAIGAIYGYLKPGNENRTELFMKKVLQIKWSWSIMGGKYGNSSG